MGNYGEDIAPVLADGSNYVTTENDFRLNDTHSTHDLRKFGFASRIVSIWNRTEAKVVIVKYNGTTE